MNVKDAVVYLFLTTLNEQIFKNIILFILTNNREDSKLKASIEPHRTHLLRHQYLPLDLR